MAFLPQSRVNTAFTQTVFLILFIATLFFVDAKNFAYDATENESVSNSQTSENDPEKDCIWFRLIRDDKAPVKLQTSIVSYTGEYQDADGSTRPISVDLIGAIHLADKEYYEAINNEFKGYETVVFELVANKGVDIKEVLKEERESKEKEQFSPLDVVSISQVFMGKALDLVYQMDGIDYTADNLVRGDIDAEEFIVQLFANGDVGAFLTDMILSAFFGETSDGQAEGMIAVLISAKDRRLALRRLFALELLKSSIADVEKEAKSLESSEKPERESVLIQMRNKKAIQAVQRELKSGKSKIAVFYGAAHLPDLENRLKNDLELRQTGEPRWFTAWDMTKK
ncbi:MAG: hypothetical protein IKX88_13835 [Thermoguttaceae bacterium]|nr:hypothetical protein [Thermoguttaceae bacterium]